ncbi:c-type cytochrome [Pseudoduganella sp. FT25W]|uniref:C-type cytochrome n=1 Tax=Duganella alba TaxID=2666081 RepID=A0A6L5Q9M8_9BURK|nr:di-heme oxidoredictase family protein [Duganella alba]MRX06513.1 c-type cytochrome [Duganella alba]MRX14907.1 c-type cytochrome [Duganella alba]
MESFHKFTRTALPIALSLALAACGGGSDSSPASSARTMGMLKQGGALSQVALTPVGATASSSERGDLNAAAAIDANDNTRWGSGFSDNEWLTLDFGQSQTINRVNIKWENAHATEYELQVSDDNKTWTALKHVTGSAGGVEDLTGLNGQGRYLRMQGIKRSTGYGYSIFEIVAYTGGDVATPPPEDPTQPTQPQQPVDITKPGVAIKPVKVTSSAVEGGNTADLTIDGKLNTRWSSLADNGAWIQFDFGAKTQVGYMKLTWENAYGKQYNLLVSDDGQTWTQIRAVSNGQGGTEEFFNLGVNARYIQLQGVQRATQYGYSLFEVEFKTPGSDNSLSTSTVTSALPFPASGSGLTPLPSYAQPLESTSFTLADGTIVTRWGARGVGRHGRERGEDWNEIGYGPNDTVDPVTGAPVDKGPGAYLIFVANYFKNRTWGLEMIDNSRVAGVTKPTLIFNEYHQTQGLRGNTVFFRRFDDPGSTGYGWMVGREIVQDNNQPCDPVAYPANFKLNNATGINNGCTLLIKEYPRHGNLNSAGFPDGTTADARPLKVGDVIEAGPSMFAVEAAMKAKGDNGGFRYYANEWTYVVGQGLRPWYGIQPRLNSTPIPDQYLQGGTGSVSYDYADNGDHMFQQPQNNIGMQNMQRFVEGRRLVHTNFTTGMHNEPGNDRYDPAVGLQGQHYGQSACIGCHVNNGRSPAPIAANQRLDNMTVRVAVTDATGKQAPHPQYGTAVQMNAVAANGAAQNWGMGVRVAGFESRIAKLVDGTSVELRKPTIAFEGPTPDTVSLRMAQPMLGVGLLEAIPEADILARVRTTADDDGVKGVANYVYDPETGAVRLGRFGWKAAKATLRHQAAAALVQDMSVTSSLYPNRSCLTDPANCKSAPAQNGVSEAELTLITQYLSLVAVPAQRALTSGFPKGVSPLKDLDVDPAKIAKGGTVFQGMRCAACHTVDQKTGAGSLYAELRNQSIKPYTDLLLHDMGDGLADKFVEGQAKGNMWRTAPLWGIGYSDTVMGTAGKAGYLHDGRARNLTEAIMWHGGEATKSRQRFENLTAADRDALLAFLKSL